MSANKSAKVTVEEVPGSPSAIEGVSTSTFATAGWSKRGRTDKLVRVASYAEFENRLGKFWSNSYTAYAASGFFANGGKSMLFRRVVPADAAAAEHVVSDMATAASFTGRPFASGVAALTATKVKVGIDAFAQTEIELVLAKVAIALQNDVSGPTFSDKTSAANSATTADLELFPTTEAIGDYFAVGFQVKFNKLTFDSTGGTPGVAGVVAWEYWNGTAWASLSGVTDGTSSFTAAAGTQSVTFTIPTDWETTTLNSSAQRYFVRARVTTVFTTNPVYDRAYVSYQTPYALEFLAQSGNNALAEVNASLASVFSVFSQTTNAGSRSRLRVTSPTSGTSSHVIFAQPGSSDATLELLGVKTTLYIPTALTLSGLAAAASRYVIAATGEGAWGDDLRATISGNQNFKTAAGGWSKFDLTVEEELDGNGDFTVRESYAQVVLDDDADPAFVSDFVGTRSNFLSIEADVDFGVPRDLSPATYQNEFLGDAVGDDVLVTFTGRLLHAPNRKNVTIATTIATTGAVSVTDNGSGSFSGTGIVSGTVNYTTGEISVTFSFAVTSGSGVFVNYTSTPAQELSFDLASGADGTGPLTRALVSDPSLAASKGGIYMFDDVTDEVLQFGLPDFAGTLAVHQDLISWAEGRKDVFLILDPAVGLDEDGVSKYVLDDAQFNTSYGAIYWPWLAVPDSLANGAPRVVPPCGHVAGVFARTDATRNVAKAPGGVADGKLNGTVGLERTVSEANRDVVAAARVNPMIAERQTGRAVWGVRTLSLDGNWKYIQARRFFQFVEKSIYLASWWAVFETIGPDLFSRIGTNVDAFLRGLLIRGFFPSKNKDEAYAVVVDGSNNDESTADQGVVIIDIFLAPSKPAEFVKFRFRQKVGAASA